MEVEQIELKLKWCFNLISQTESSFSIIVNQLWMQLKILGTVVDENELCGDKNDEKKWKPSGNRKRNQRFVGVVYFPGACITL